MPNERISARAGLSPLILGETAETRFTVAGTFLESGMNRQSSKLTACGLHERGNLRLHVDRDRLQRVYTSRGGA